MVYNTDKTKEQTIDEALFKILLVLVPSISRAVSVVNDFFNIDIKYLSFISEMQSLPPGRSLLYKHHI